MLKGIELGKISASDTELAIIKEEASNAIFAVETSYLEQDVGPIISPYANGCVSLDGTDRELWVVSGRMWGDDDDTVMCIEVRQGEDAGEVFKDRMVRDSCSDPNMPPDLDELPEDGDGSVIVVQCIPLSEFLAGKV